MKVKDFVDLVTDAKRRDLSINSIACDIDDGNKYIDPFNGMDDLKNKILRHTSDAFSEDPVRVLRIARFRARYGSDWTIADDTVALISKMSKKGVLNELQPDRIWKEVSRALMEKNPQIFFETLLQVDALHSIFPMLYKLVAALESNRWHPEGNAFSHVMLVLKASADMNATLEERFACLVHDIGKGLTPFDKLPKHYGHDINGVPLVDKFAKTMAVPSSIVKNAKLATKYHMRMHELPNLKASTLVKMFDDLKAGHSHENAVDVLRMVGAADHRGRKGKENASLDFLDFFDRKLAAFRSAKFSDIFDDGNVPKNVTPKDIENFRKFKEKKVKDA
jgi:tRNA nucleotidyltransferase (CCA-adding enzyme)